MNTAVSYARAATAGLCLGFILHAAPATAADPAQIPTICVSSVDANNLVVAAHIRAGFSTVVLETRPDAATGNWTSHVSGPVDGREGTVVFTAPSPGPNSFYRIRTGNEGSPPPAAYSGAAHFTVVYGLSSCLFSENERIGHVLNRLAYGPSEYDLQLIASIGLEAWINQQSNPASIDESSNTALNTREAGLFYSFVPAAETKYVKSGDVVRYWKGTSEPPASWKNTGFADSGWLTGATGIGYGDDDLATTLPDMMNLYTTVYLRKVFNVSNPAAIEQLQLRANYDDGFVAYLNGTEIVRTNAPANPVFSSQATAGHEAGTQETWNITAYKNLLQSGANVLAVIGLNVTNNSSDFTINPEVVGVQTIPGALAQTRIKSVTDLQRLVHIRGTYSRKQLQTVLAEFLENHLTTDYDKVRDYFDDLSNSDGSDAMPYTQAEREAAHAEFREFDFFYQNALGHFGDLLLFSATSPAQLIYLDNILNVKGAPNENYAREILELYAFGVDNRYTQADIEELARCFTGWTVRKTWPQDAPSFPDSARNPPTTSSVQFQDTPVVDLGAGWRYFKGTTEPTPVNNLPTTAWAELAYNDAGWLAGASPVGYGDVGFGTTTYYGTQLLDMQQKTSPVQAGYSSVYLRRKFTVTDPATVDKLVLSVGCDDGFVAYLNGIEIARNSAMGIATPPAYSALANANGVEPLINQDFSLRNYTHLLLPAPQENVLAVQLHNVSRTSSDAAVAPRIVLRTALPGSIESGDPNGVWTFRFNPNQHDTNSKTLFPGTPYQMSIPAGRTGLSGLLDATDVIDAMVGHPSTAEFLCIKLVNRFVSDEISLDSYHSRTAPEELLTLVDNAIAAWNTPVNGRKGHLGTVVQAVTDPIARVNVFWGDAGYKTKIKTPVEFINSTLRALNSQVSTNADLPSRNALLGMNLFTRDEPNGWSELGHKWMDSGTLLQRIEFSRLAANGASPTGNYYFDMAGWVAANNLTSAAAIVNYFNSKFLQGTLTPEHVNVLVTYGNTDTAGNPSVLNPANSAHAARVRELVGLILSLPQWQYQ